MNVEGSNVGFRDGKELKSMLLGSAFRSEDELVAALRRIGEHELSPAHSIGKLLPIDAVKLLARGFAVFPNRDDRSGIPGRFDLAQRIVEQSDPEVLYTALQRLEHDFNFPYVSFFKLGDDLESSLQSREVLRANLIALHGLLPGRLRTFSNAFANPPGRHARLDSAFLSSDRSALSLIFAQHRVLGAPGTDRSGFEGTFAARVPVRVLYLFDIGIVEVGLLDCAEKSVGGRAIDLQPARSFRMINSVTSALGGLGHPPLQRTDISKLLLHLEYERGAVDMGWDISRPNGGDLDVEQRSIPLRQILTDFLQDVADACTQLGRHNHFGQLDLYAVFRALQARSHTRRMTLGVPFGARGGSTKIQTYFGNRDDAEPTVIRFMKSPVQDHAAHSLRAAVRAAIESEVENPYTVETLFPDEALPC